MKDIYQSKDFRQLFGFIATDAEKTKAINEQDHSIKFIIRSDKVDRQNERVEVSAVIKAIKAFGEDTIPVLACHKHALDDGKPPAIGSWDPVSFKAFKHHSEMRLNFAVDTELGLAYWKLYSKKHMRAVSIGFRIIEGYEEVIKGVHTYVITKIELYEISCVAVGACREALSKLKAIYGDGILGNGPNGPTDTKAIANEVTKEVKRQITIWLEDNETIIQINENLEEIKSLLVPDSQQHAEALLEEPSDPALAAGTSRDTETALCQLKSIENLIKGI